MRYFNSRHSMLGNYVQNKNGIQLANAILDLGLYCVAHNLPALLSHQGTSVVDYIIVSEQIAHHYGDSEAYIGQQHWSTPHWISSELPLLYYSRIYVSVPNISIRVNRSMRAKRILDLIRQKRRIYRSLVRSGNINPKTKFNHLNAIIRLQLNNYRTDMWQNVESVKISITGKALENFQSLNRPKGKIQTSSNSQQRSICYQPTKSESS